jgi:hypothetical protein
MTGAGPASSPRTISTAMGFTPEAEGFRLYLDP